MKSVKVVKIGGNVVESEELLRQFLEDFSRLDGPKVLVHGGGVMATDLQKRLGSTPVMINGRRVTDSEALKIVTMAYAGWCSKHVVALLQGLGCNAVGLSGADGNVIRAVRRPVVRQMMEDGTVSEIDYGYAGDPVEVNTGFIGALFAQGIVPVVCAITHDGNGSLLNTNADTVASTLACALAEENEVSLVFCFEKDGVLYVKNDEKSLIQKITPSYYSQLKLEGRVADGMIPKLDNAFKAIDSGVKRVEIKNARNIGNSTGTVLEA